MSAQLSHCVCCSSCICAAAALCLLQLLRAQLSHCVCCSSCVCAAAALWLLQQLLLRHESASPCLCGTCCPAACQPRCCHEGCSCCARSQGCLALWQRCCRRCIALPAAVLSGRAAVVTVLHCPLRCSRPWWALRGSLARVRGACSRGGCKAAERGCKAAGLCVKVSVLVAHGSAKELSGAAMRRAVHGAARRPGAWRPLGGWRAPLWRRPCDDDEHSFCRFESIMM